LTEQVTSSRCRQVCEALAPSGGGSVRVQHIRGASTPSFVALVPGTHFAPKSRESSRARLPRSPARTRSCVGTMALPASKPAAHAEDTMYAMIDLSDPETGVAVPERAPASRSPLRSMPNAAPVQVGILAYQAAWQTQFHAESDLLERAFAPLLPFVEHVGTTAIPGSAARPIIDIAVGVAKPAAVQFMLETLRGHGYRPSDRVDADFGQRMFVRERNGAPTHHVHVVEHQGTAWQDMLCFRDVLRGDDRLAREYEWLRRRFAGQHPANRVAYVRAKTTFITTIINVPR
jgi:GrpB-like predicted nucleotidyltransferase (UPF0157 family)